jgi:uncharacterized membrane protein
MSLYLAVRWVHVIAATSWYGEVVTINFVLVPVLAALPREEASRFLSAVFPVIFKLASWLSATAMATGLFLAWNRFASSPELLWTTFSGRAFTVGATMGILLTTFHFVLEPKLDGMICSARENNDLDLSDKVIRQLRVVPRVGLLVITIALMLMMIGARGV